MASTQRISTSSWWSKANACANADLPDAVGPTSATATCSVLTSGVEESEPYDAGPAPWTRTPPTSGTARHGSRRPSRVIRREAAHPPEESESICLDGYAPTADRKSTRLNSSHLGISYAVFCLKKKKN